MPNQYTVDLDQSVCAYEHLNSNAVLTPELNAKSALIENKVYPMLGKHIMPKQLTELEKRNYRNWCERQVLVLENSLSNAVLGELK